MSKLIEDFKLYRDRFGLNQLYTDGTQGLTSQNGTLFTMEYLICLLEDLDTSDEEKHQQIMRICLVFDTCQTWPGLSVRYPGDREGDSMDNNAALLTFSALFDSGTFAKDMLEHGERTRAKGIDMVQDPVRNTKYYPIAKLVNLGREPRFFWNNTLPDLFCIWGWYGRSPGFIAYLRMTAGRRLFGFGQLCILVSQFLGCFKDPSDTDARKLPYVCWYFLSKRGFFWRMAYKLWCWKLMRDYPNGMADVYAKYYSDPNHPIRKYAKPHF